MVINCRVAG
jgi:hypothetical protein